MKWPYNKRLEAAHAWGLVGVGTAGIVAIPTVLATLHATDHHFRWWWPTNWMVIPVTAFFIGILLAVLPVQRRVGKIAIVNRQAIRSTPDVTGDVEINCVAGDAAAIRAKTATSGKLTGRAKARRVEKGAELSGIDIDHIG